MPLLEAFPDETQMMKYKLVSLSRGTCYNAYTTIRTQLALTIANGAPFNIVPNTINYLNLEHDPRTSSGYQFTISDS